MRRLIFILLSFIPMLLMGQYTVYNPYDGVSFDTSYKSNLHMHTIESDGSQTVEQRIIGDESYPVAEAWYGYVDSAYSILSITDHDSYEVDPTPEFSGPGTTWPWHCYEGMTDLVPTVTYIWATDTSSIYYGDLEDGVLAVRGNEFTACQQDDNYYTHINTYFSDLGYNECPADGFTGYFDAVDSVDGMAIFNHPGRHEANAAFYNDYFDDYYGIVVGIEIYNFGDYYSEVNPRETWDSINALRGPDSLIWGFSNSDVHNSGFTNDEWRNYNQHFCDTLTEAAFRANLLNGAFTASYDENCIGDVRTPELTGVTIGDNYIKLTASNCDSIRWFDNSHDSILTNDSVNLEGLTTNFVRAELYNEYGITNLQPFGVEEASYPGDYYVSVDGDDEGEGTYTDPWATPQKAFETAVAGDTVYFRGGRWTPSTYESGSDIYNYDVSSGNGNSGTYGNRIYYMAYNGELPVFDFSNATPSGDHNVGLYMEDVHYVTFKGLKFVGLDSTASTGPNVHVVNATACSNLEFIECVIDSSGGAGLRYFSGIGDDVGISVDTTKIINCDFYRCVNNGGEHGDGIKYDQDAGAYLLVEGCRFMFNSDDGLDASGSGMRVVLGNWAFGQGWETGGNGNGFKVGALRDTLEYPSIIFAYNLSAFNHNPTTNSAGGLYIPDYQVSDTSYRRANARIYNNTMFANDIGFREVSNPLWDFRNCVYRNNIAYGSLYDQDGTTINTQMITYSYPESHNTWDFEDGGFSFVETDTVTVTDADFMSIDSTSAASELMGERNADGSLPSLTFMQLSEGSDLVDAGTTYGWSEFSSYANVPAQVVSGTAPDIGAFEYTGSSPSGTSRRPAMGANGVLAIDKNGNPMKFEE